ncbi:hypothetical protein BWQ96_07079 [Gracilariopsis chorda]|uniref:Uncharacterized protein n=1 Tax=Gracilariopsis chorda TaxID=448386 RepID=A0A2V3IM29_9FLOR|nr:hypothetical protein BWQ96_07079 [Gracilariopsis chorda]|eukprot:PXF43135.1 hypothetical protein BWQ96_07079 [Gracilariopsis chorda]
MNSLGTVNESDEISLNAEQMEKVCGQESYDYEKEKRAEGPVAKTEEGSAAEHADAQCSDRNSCKGNSDNYVVLSDGIHSDAGSPRETITGEDREEASSADCTGDYDSSNMNSSSPPSAARGGSETESTAASADDPETDSDELTISEQSDDSSGSRGAVSNEPGHTAGSSPSPHSSRNSTNHSGTNPGDDSEVEDETDGAHEECGTSLDTSQDEGSIVGQVLSTIRSVLASFRRRATGSSDEAMDRLSSEPSSGSDQHAREDGSISDDTEESSRSSHTESSSAIISGSQGEDEREYGAGSEPTTQSPAASDGLHEIHDTETSDLDVPLSSVAVEDRSMDDGEVRDSQDFNSSTDGEEGSDESSVIEDSDHSSQVISSSTVDDETDSDEMDLLSGSGSQYSA